MTCRSCVLCCLLVRRMQRTRQTRTVPPIIPAQTWAAAAGNQSAAAGLGQALAAPSPRRRGRGGGPRTNEDTMCSMAMLESLSLGRSMSRFFTSHAYFCARRLPCADPTLHLQNIAPIKCTSTLQVPSARATCQTAVWCDSAHPGLLGMQPASRSALQSGQAASPPPRRSHRTKRGNVIAVNQPFVHAACSLQGEAERARDRPACPPAARAGPIQAAPGLAVAAG
jgi:hypothetical protein